MARTIEPTLTDAQSDYLLWERTCFPCGGLRTIYRQLSSAIRATRNGIHVCELCHNKVEPGVFNCASCERALARIRNEQIESRLGRVS